MSIFSQTRDIVAANFADLLDKAEDPAKMIRMIILEMEETLVEVRASAARTIADQKEMRRQISRLDKLQGKLREARTRQNAIQTRLESANQRTRLREMYAGPKVDDAFSRFDVL